MSRLIFILRVQAVAAWTGRPDRLLTRSLWLSLPKRASAAALFYTPPAYHRRLVAARPTAFLAVYSFIPYTVL
ncbi:hypothetical protein BGW36DRAFT_212642 [Talaromyces proteolyticus]|uniref:Secreted protein n=1 Tax=Talaromyces proteolyticus TaxID=1131652 RepID=A0AAD4KRD4_9EURO|nr:uncharacterized protein BGW36DRAFT_212642 [Talaromyces proteolyticus]KAH8693917.1 hypothetical protein BGW36DRAFT_212642 [Talaromyces proteolyticus]